MQGPYGFLGDSMANICAIFSALTFGLLCSVAVDGANGMKAVAQDKLTDPVTTAAIKRGPSGLPLPRFASLKSSAVNMRIGPGHEHAIQWRYIKEGLPVEILVEYDNWRKVRDVNGTEGWIFHSMLSGKRTAVIEPEAAQKVESIEDMLAAKSADPVMTIKIFASPNNESRVLALAEPGVIAELYECDKIWCAAKVGETKGWVEQSRLWGVYQTEKFDD